MATATGERWRAFWPARGLAALTDYAAVSHRRAAAVLTALALCAFVPGIVQIPPVDREEARFAQATKQMLESGDYIDIRFRNDARYRVPVGIYWLQAAAVNTGAALGVRRAHTRIWLYRIPSLIGALGAVLLTYWCALAFVSRRGAVLASTMLAASVLLGLEARLAKTDAMLLFTVVAAMGAFARAYLATARNPDAAVHWSAPAIFWTALAAGVLVKGPLILILIVLAATTLMVADRSAHWIKALRPLFGTAWFIALVAPWFVAIGFRTGGGFFAEAFGWDVLARLLSGQEWRGAPPGFYFVLFWVTFWPAATLAGLAARVVWSVRRELAARFLLAWIVPAWIALEIVPIKLPHFVLPLYPAIAILIAGAVESRVLARERWLVRGTIWWFVVPVLVGIGLIVAVITLGRQPGFLAWPFVVGAVIAGLLAWRLYAVDGAERALLRATAASVFLAIAAYGVVVPSLGTIFPSVTLANVLRGSGCEHPQAASAGFYEPSLVFLAGTQIRLTDGSGAADFLREGGCRFAFVEARQQRSFAQRAEAIGLRYSPGRRTEAVNVANGRELRISVYRTDPLP
jgi:4-amino-4-deoxy-L-arabinose transferase-like glycosyltransferase